MMVTELAVRTFYADCTEVKRVHTPSPADQQSTEIDAIRQCNYTGSMLLFGVIQTHDQILRPFR